jgi:hypothetical protein
VGWLSGIPDISDRRLRDFRYLCQPVSGLYRSNVWARNADEVAITVANRLAQMTYRMERTPCNDTCIAARWYLENLKSVQISPECGLFVNPVKGRLWKAIHDFEARMGYQCEPDEFGRLVGTTDQERNSILYGPPTTNIWHRSFPVHGNTPWGRLVWWISLHCWACIADEN